MSGKVTELETLLVPVVEALGYTCWGIEYLSQGKHTLLRVYIDHPDGVSVEACAAVSRQASAVLDVEDPITESFTLEVSSAGVDRPLTRLTDFERFKGFKAKVETRFLVEGRRRFSGTLGGVENGNQVRITTEEGDALLAFGDMAKAKLIATDELFEAAKAGTLPKPVSLADLKTSDSTAGSTPAS